VNKVDSSIMILTASYGNGHKQAAQALKQRLHLRGINKVHIIDLMKEAYPVLNTITTTIYEKSTQAPAYGLDYYGWSYYMTRDSKQDGPLNKYFNLLGKKKLREFIDLERPDAIINTFPFGAAPETGRHLDIPTFTVVTDYALHSRWIHSDVHKYYVATDELKAELLDKGLAPEQVEVSGIPIRQAFQAISESSNAFQGILDPRKKTVLISAGSYGIFKHIEKMAESLVVKGNCQIAVVCGRDKRLEHKLNLLFQYHPDIHIFGFIEHIHELMAVSSCILTKAGGLTLTEAITLQLPIFVYRPLSGQEKENARFLSQKGVAAISLSPEELENQLLHCLSDDTYAGQIRSRMAALRKDASADYIAKSIIEAIAKEALQPV
jgi:processive 1,2-diacylglycerol beta-glucosyltransferase